MTYINDSLELNNMFVRLMWEYQHYYWMVAWAGKPMPHFEELAANQEKIRCLVVGIKFYQTSVTFIEMFNRNPQVRFNKSISGVFHPKVYLFVNDENNWEVLIGSSNFTRSAFGSNNEASMVIHSSEADPDLLRRVKDSIEEAWRQGGNFTDDELEDYRAMVKGADGDDGEADGRDEGGLPAGVPIVSMTWRDYIDRIFASGHGQIRERLKMLDFVADYFQEFPVFSDMPFLLRKRVGGYIKVGQPANFELFGGMKQAMIYKREINRNPQGISAALDAIPSEGEVTDENYWAFVDQFNVALEGGNKYRSGTRLLAMKRPDVFFALSRGNNVLLSADFGILDVENMNFERYWNQVILTMRRADWYLNPLPINNFERRIERYKAAFMDAMYYRPV